MFGQSEKFLSMWKLRPEQMMQLQERKEGAAGASVRMEVNVSSACGDEPLASDFQPVPLRKDLPADDENFLYFSFSYRKS